MTAPVFQELFPWMVAFSLTSLKDFLENLSEDKKNLVKTDDIEIPFKFGDLKVIVARKSAVLPAVIVGKEAYVTTAVINADIPMLLSKEAMKNAKVKIDFENDKICILGCELDNYYSATGHYCVPLIGSHYNLNTDNVNNIYLTENELQDQSTQEKVKTASKLHRQFWSCKTLSIKKYSIDLTSCLILFSIFLIFM